MRCIPMKNLSRLLLCLSLLALLVLPVLPITAQTNIGATPSSARFGSVQPGTEFQKTITISNGMSDPVSAHVQKAGELGQWLSFPDGQNFTIPANGSYSLYLSLNVPVGTPSGTYSGEVTVSVEPTQNFTGLGAAAEITLGVTIAVTADVGGSVASDIDLPNNDITILKAQQGSPIEAQIDVTNNGNVALAPTVVVKIYDAHGNVVKTYSPPQVSIPATTSSKLDLTIPSDGLAPGTYKMVVTVSLAGTEIGKLEKTFTITEVDEIPGGGG